MKKTLALALLGSAVATTAFGQGGIVIGNYQGAYNQVVWGPGGPQPADTPVRSTDGIQLSIWYGEGTDASALTETQPLTWNTVAEGNGYYGYYNLVTLTLPSWQAGDVFSFQVRAQGPGVDQLASRSAIWQEQTNIGNTGGIPPGPPGFSTESIGLTVVVPEPSTFALAGLGAAALLIFRRRA
jgi:hypothetical protein